MWNAAFSRFGSRYILVMTLLTRLLGLIGGLLTIYYVQVTLVRLPPQTGRHFQVAGLLATVAAVLATSILAHHLTQNLRIAVRRLQRGLPLDAELGASAYREAMTFVGRQLLREAFLVPLVTTVPVCIYLRMAVGMEFSALQHIVVATMLGIALSLLLMFFTMEQAMQPVIRYLFANGLAVDLEELPLHPLHVKMNLCFGIIIVCTVTMIGSMASRRAQDLIESPESLEDAKLAVVSLREHTLFISLAALVVGLVYSRLLARSVTHRVAHLVHVMKRVERGALFERVQPTGIDEIDLLTQQFNRMVGELEQKDRTVRDLNANLERKVRVRTRELARSKQSLQQSLEKLRESNRHKTEFFSNVSHELRTPLMMILSPIEQLTHDDGAELDEAARCLLNVASVNAQRLLNLINQLLDLSKLEAGHASLQRGPVEFNDLVQQLVAAATPLAQQRGLALETDFDPHLRTLNADAEKLDVVVTNLLSNALKFTPRGGSVHLSTALEEHPGGPRVRFEIRDTGIGIAPENLDRLFQRFVQVDGSSSREFAGTGLGLALAREFVQLHGGAIGVASEPEVGSTFWFEFPVTHVDHAPFKVGGARPVRSAHRFADLVECDVPRRRRPAPSAARHILVVDDTPEVRHMLGDMLAPEYHVTFANDGSTGWLAVRDNPPDLIISDVMMPGTDGYEFCRRVKSDSATAAIPFVLLTAQAQTSQKIAGLNDGADDYLIKPFEEEELLARVRSLLRIREMHNELAANNTSLERTLAELRRTQDQLVQSEKMSSLGQLVAGLAHEINNSINAVYNGIPTIIERTDRLERLVDEALADQTPEARQDIESGFSRIRMLSHVVAEGAERTARIIGDMKSFAHPGVAAVEQFDPNQSLQVCMNLLAAQFHERVRVHRDFSDVGMVRGHFGQLNQVLLNLLTNAVQAMPDGGEIFVSTRREERTVVISIRDTGPGISAEHRARIFDPFFTTKPPGHGTGLGLSISYGIVRRMGGTIECRSEPGQGAEFLLRLPSAGESAGDSHLRDDADVLADTSVGAT